MLRHAITSIRQKGRFFRTAVRARHDGVSLVGGTRNYMAILESRGRFGGSLEGGICRARS
jgi:hypothetical protein